MKRFCVLFAAAWIAAGVFCFGAHAGETTVTVMTHDSFSMSEPLVKAFEKQTGIRLEFIKGGDTGVALNQAILSKNNPLADIFYGVDNTFISRAIAAGIFESYASPLLKDIPTEFQLDPENRLLPVDYGDVCLNYDSKWFAEKYMAPPTDLKDLITPAYNGLTVVEHPASSSPGLAFLLATVARFGEDHFADYWQQFRQNDVLITNSWTQAYWGHYSAASKGDRPVVVSYATSPPAEVHFAEKPVESPRTTAVTAAKTCYRQIEFISILKGTKNRSAAEKTIDFFLSKNLQEDIPLQMFMFPVNPKAELPDVFVKHGKIAVEPLSLPTETIHENREKWINTWAETVLR